MSRDAKQQGTGKFSWCFDVLDDHGQCPHVGAWGTTCTCPCHSNMTLER